MKSPLVSIILPCYNAEKYLKYALESIINQDYKNLEILCIDDGSSDGTLNILKEYQLKDERIIIIQNEENKGLIYTLNKALTLVKGEYFARMDADDYSPSSRIHEQIEFISKNPHLDLICSGYYRFIFDNVKNEYLTPLGIYPNAIKFISIFSNPCVHGSILGHTSLIKRGIFKYDVNYPHAEDFELFSRLTFSNYSIGAINKPLYWLRSNQESVSYRFKEIQTVTNVKILTRNLATFIEIPVTLNTSILKLLLNRIDNEVTISEIRTAYNFFNVCFNKMDTLINFNQNERKEIENYLTIHKLNILIQCNKYRFLKLGYKNLLFFLKSLTLLEIKQIKLLCKKLIAKF